jgi:NADP-dependent 3-hydroxy acid dehydrogenase YdfG
MDLTGKIALVTGGGSGIGLGIALALAREGCQVVVCGRDADRLRRAAAEFDGRPPILPRPCDVARREQVGELVRGVETELGAIDVLVNSAGVNVARRSIAELAPDDWDRMLAVNATGAFNMIHAVLPGMRRRDSGLIVNISSIAGKRAMELAGPGYCASKFALSALGTAVALEERAHGIRVTNVYPGEVDTPILEQRPTPVPPERRAEMVRPEDVAACVVTVARLPDRVQVPELIITPRYQGYA